MIKQFLILSNMYPTEKTPSQGVFVRNIEQSLLDSGIDVTRVVVAGRHNHVLAKLLHYMLYVVNAFFTLLFTKRVVYLHYVAHSSIPFLVASFFRKIPMVAHVHGGDVMPAEYEPERVRKVKVWIARKALKKADKIIVPSHYFKGFLIDEFDVEAGCIEINPSGGVNTQKFSNAEKTAPAFLQNKPLVLGYVGRLDSGKGVDTLIKSLKGLDKAFHCHFVGTGLYHHDFEALAQENGIQDNVTFHGAVEQSELPSKYASFDYLVFPSEMQESLGLVGLEAMACGTPVIGSMNAGMADYLSDQVNGFGFKSGDITSLTDCLVKAAEVNAKQYAAFSTAARETALEFDAQKSNAHLLEILK